RMHRSVSRCRKRRRGSLGGRRSAEVDRCPFVRARERADGDGATDPARRRNTGDVLPLAVERLQTVAANVSYFTKLGGVTSRCNWDTKSVHEFDVACVGLKVCRKDRPIQGRT